MNRRTTNVSSNEGRLTYVLITSSLVTDDCFITSDETMSRAKRQTRASKTRRGNRQPLTRVTARIGGQARHPSPSLGGYLALAGSQSFHWPAGMWQSEFPLTSGDVTVDQIPTKWDNPGDLYRYFFISLFFTRWAKMNCKLIFENPHICPILRQMSHFCGDVVFECQNWWRLEQLGLGYQISPQSATD